MPISPHIKQCNFIPLGKRCGSPAVLGHQRCYHHQRAPITAISHLPKYAQIAIEEMLDPEFEEYLDCTAEMCAERLLPPEELLEHLLSMMSWIFGFDFRKPRPAHLVLASENPRCADFSPQLTEDHPAMQALNDQLRALAAKLGVST